MLPLGPLQAEWTGIRSTRLDAALQRAGALVRKLLRGARERAAIRCEIECRRATSEVPALDDDESYRLIVHEGGIRLSAETEWGVLRGLATLAQLAARLEARWVLPLIEVEDAPRFPWRGLMLDPARRFLSVEALIRTLDAMAFYKLNVLHLHLSDDQGFRFPSERFPRLPDIGGSGLFYTRDELRRVVQHGAGLGIRIVPELDLPGHCTSWLAAYPEWGARSERLSVSERFGVHEALLDPTRAGVMAGISELLAELCDVFPDAYVHIGGDEVEPTWWIESAAIRSHMEANGFAEARDLQADFNRRLGEMLERLGKRMVGWDEISHPSLGRSAVVQSWRGSAARDMALARGFDCVISAGYYLDLFYPADLHYAVDPADTPAGDAAREEAMLRDPRLAHVRDGLRWMARFASQAVAAAWPTSAPCRAGRVLGGEACLWGELVSEQVLDLRLWSRMPAIAERLWSDRSVASIDAMYARLDRTLVRLAQVTAVDLATARAELFRSLGLSDDEYHVIGPLLDTLEPTKWYARLLGHEAMLARVIGVEVGQERPYGTTTPLDRVADYLLPESRWAREFGRKIDAVIANPARQDLCEAVSRVALAWRGQRALVSELEERAPALAELEPLAEALGELADVLLRCLTAVSGGLTPAECDALDAELERLSAPHGELVIAVIPALRRLVAACAGSSGGSRPRGH
jgi:hexosaminidase